MQVPWGKLLGGLIGLMAAGCAASAPAAASGLQASRIAFGDQGEGTRVEVELSRQVEPRIFLLANPPRLVVDLPPLTWRLAAGHKPGHGLVAAYRYGNFNERTSRLVLDLAGPARLRRSAFEGGATAASVRLLLELEPVAAEQFSGLVQTPDRPPPPRPGTEKPNVEAGPRPNGEAAPKPTASVPPPEPAAVAGGSGVAAKPLLQAAAMTPRANKPPPSPPRAERRTIVLDPGHGGIDPGAIGAGGTLEKNVTLAAAREMRRQLEATGRYRVVMTRDGDTFLRLRDRFARARTVNADLFISIHADTMPNRSVRGGTIYTLSDTASDAEAAALAQRENRADIIAGIDLTQENREVVNILIDLAQRETMNSSAKVAAALVAEMGRDGLLLPARPHRFAGFAVLKAPDVPSILLEMGYLSNREDEGALQRPRHRTKVAQAVVRAVDAYFARLSRPTKS